MCLKKSNFYKDKNSPDKDMNYKVCKIENRCKCKNWKDEKYDEKYVAK